jgi:S-DNA-T family DNA segregation ATPase FtsK/SpoIIIE
VIGLSVALVLVVAAASLLRWRRPAWYWMTFGVTLASLRVLFRYPTVMDACGLTVPPSRWRLALPRATNRPAPESRPPRILLLRLTRTGLLLRLKLRSGQDAFDVVAASDRLRHSFSMYGVTSRELRSGVVEVRMTGYDVLKRVQMPATTQTRPMRVAVALREDGSTTGRYPTPSPWVPCRRTRQELVKVACPRFCAGSRTSSRVSTR